MKSMLHEASSVLKAIQKAWQESGQPAEFTIKILESGEKGFLWFTKRPAIISISYEPKNTFKGKPSATEKKERAAFQGLKTPSKNQLSEGSPQRKETFVKDRSQENKAFQDQRTPRPLSGNHQKSSSPQDVSNLWNQDSIEYIVNSLKEIIGQLNITTPFSVQTESKTLTITFDGQIMPTKEDERHLFISLSYLLIQFLKKKTKKKLKGIHLIITSKASSYTHGTARHS